MPEELEGTVQGALRVALNIPIAIFLLALALMVLVQTMDYTSKIDLKLLSHSLAGSINAIGSAPEKAAYCVEMPSTKGRDIFVKTVESDDFWSGLVVVSSKADEESTFNVFPTSVNEIETSVPEGETYVLKIVKDLAVNAKTYSKRIEDVDCGSVVLE